MTLPELDVEFARSSFPALSTDWALFDNAGGSVSPAFGQAAVNVTDLCQAARITSKRQVQSLLVELESAGLVRSRRLHERGQPRVIETIASMSTDGITDETGTEGGPNG